MTLDEAIKHEEEVAEKNEEESNNWTYGASRINNDESWSWRRKQYLKHAKKWHECANEHRQLAEWLKELKKYRERIPSYEAGYNDAKKEIALSGEYERAYKRGYMDAMEYCTNKLGDVNKQMEDKC